jgi:hypothetical protein
MVQIARLHSYIALQLCRQDNQPIHDMHQQEMFVLAVQPELLK